ncbi:MAG: MlaA family lipoprotein [Alphaproteobacteria bacterium]
MKKKFLTLAVLAGFSGFFLSGCASDGDQYVLADGQEISDPFEGVNRKVFAFNAAVDEAIIHPTLKGYRLVVPSYARTGLGNFLNNLKSPVVFGNQLLQGDLEGAGTSFVRATINTILGVGGLIDIAGMEGIEHEGEDFGQTLAKWGMDHGPYLVVPIVGPSSARDYVGYIVDGYADPLRWYLFNVDKEGLHYARMGLSYLDLRDDLMDVLEDLQRSSIDYYAATRSVYYQRREALVNDEDPDANAAAVIPDYDDY